MSSPARYPHLPSFVSAHCAVLESGSALAIANYMTSSVLLVPLDKEGLFPKDFEPKPITLPFNDSSSPLRNPERQDKPHPHVSTLIGK